MKKTMITLTAALLLTVTAKAQYSFSVLNRTYEGLTQSTSVMNGVTWDDPEFSVPVGFNFFYFNTLVDSLYTVGGLGADLFTKNLNISDTTDIFIPFGVDLIDRQYHALGGESPGGVSDILYAVTGTPGNQIFTMEWKNAGFYGEFADNNSGDDFINFQILFYESDQSIEIAFGPSLVSDASRDYEGETGPAIMLIGEFDGISGNFQSGYDLSGSPTAPMFQPLMGFYDNFINGTVPPNTVYRFERTNLGVEDNAWADFQIYPNPAKEFVQVNTKVTMENISITDLNGRVIQKVAPLNNEVRISLSHLNSGIYLVNLESKEGNTFTQKIIVE